MSDASDAAVDRLDRRVVVVWFAEIVVVALVLGAAAWLIDRFGPTAFGPPLPVAVTLFVLAFGAVYTVLRYRSWQYVVRADALYLERGVFTRTRTVVPFVRIQHVDASRSPFQRLLGLASTVVYTAGSRGADVTVPGLTAADADALQERLKRLAIRAEGEDAV